MAGCLSGQTVFFSDIQLILAYGEGRSFKGKVHFSSEFAIRLWPTMLVTWSSTKLLACLIICVLLIAACEAIPVSGASKKRVFNVFQTFNANSHFSLLVMLPLDVINYQVQVSNPSQLSKQLYQLKSIGVDGYVIWQELASETPFSPVFRF